MISSYVAGTIKTRLQCCNNVAIRCGRWTLLGLLGIGQLSVCTCEAALHHRCAPETAHLKNYEQKKRCQVPSPLSIVAYTLLMLVVSTNSQLINIYEENS